MNEAFHPFNATADAMQGYDDHSILAGILAGAGLILLLAIVAWVLNRRFVHALQAEVTRRTELLSHSNVELGREKRRAEAASRIKGDFLSSMSHELRTPLNAILGLSEMLEEHAEKEEDRACAGSIIAAGESLLDIINSIFDFTQIQASNLTLKPTEFEVCSLFASVSNFYSREAEQKGVAFVSEITTVGPLWVNGDQQRLRQVVTNLLSNAVKFTSKGRIRLDVETTRSSKSELSVKVTVEDTGIGIDNRDLEIIFDAFSQADNSDTRRYGGSGLGLSIALHLARLMGGRLHVASEPGAGSTFTFYLSLPIAARSQAPEPILLPHSPRRLLIVEDQLGNRTLLTLLLKKLGYSDIDAVENGRQAVETIRNRHYDAIFMDCQMPEMDGFEATQTIRAMEQPGHRAIIIAVTADAVRATAEKCFAAGMDDYMNKPIRKDEFKACLQKWQLL